MWLCRKLCECASSNASVTINYVTFTDPRPKSNNQEQKGKNKLFYCKRCTYALAKNDSKQIFFVYFAI